MNKDFTTIMDIPVSCSELYEAIHTEEGVRNWWTKFADISEEVGGISDFRFPTAGFYVVAKNDQLQQNEVVIWKVIESRHPEESGFDDLEDWVGTTIRFEIEQKNDQESRLHFTHEGLTPKLECYEACENGWTHYLNSLKDFVIDGQCEPYTDDSEDNIIRNGKK